MRFEISPRCHIFGPGKGTAICNYNTNKNLNFHKISFLSTLLLNRPYNKKMYLFNDKHRNTQKWTFLTISYKVDFFKTFNVLVPMTYLKPCCNVVITSSKFLTSTLDLKYHHGHRKQLDRLMRKQTQHNSCKMKKIKKNKERKRQKLKHQIIVKKKYMVY